MSRGSYLAYMNDFGMRLSGHIVHLAALWNASCCLALDKRCCGKLQDLQAFCRPGRRPQYRGADLHGRRGKSHQLALRPLARLERYREMKHVPNALLNS